ncbi:MAG: PHP domain-containing protein [archaeon]
MKIDLHMHTTASDGELEPRELVDWAIEKRLPVIAITDHEVVEGSREAIEYARGKNIEVVSGIEIGADEEDLKLYDVHIVGLFLDLENKGLVESSKKLIKAREVQKKEMIRRLNELGYEITFEELKKEVKGVNYGRLHIAKILMRKYDEFKEVQGVFDKLLGGSGLAYVRQKKETIKNTIGVIHGAGGIAILAHPMLYDNVEKVVERFIEGGGDGIEVDYFYENRGVGVNQDKEMVIRAREIAKEKNLVVSGGGDFHSKNDPQEIGDYGITREGFERMKGYWRQLVRR